MKRRSYAKEPKVRRGRKAVAVKIEALELELKDAKAFNENLEQDLAASIATKAVEQSRIKSSDI